MIACLDEALFGASQHHLAVLALIEMGMGSPSRHVVFTDPPFNPSRQDETPLIRDFLASLPKALAQAVADTLAEAVHQASLRAGAGILRVGDRAKSDFAKSPPRVTPADALRLLRTPLAVLVENRHSDGVFLRIVALPGQRERLLQALELGWVTIETGGGIEQLTERLREVKKNPLLHQRFWILCDRDSGKRNGLSQEAQKIETLRAECKPGPLPHGPLRRRTIENYLPLAALDLWARGDSLRRHQVEALKVLGDSLRHRFHLVKGLRVGRPQGAGPVLTMKELLAVFPDADADEQRRLRKLLGQTQHLRALQDGLGKDIKKLFTNGLIPQARLTDWLHDEVPQQERHDLIESILQRI